MLKKYFLTLGLFVIFSPSVLWGQEKFTAPEVAAKYQGSFFYPGKDFKVLVSMQLIEKGGQERIRELTMLRKNSPKGSEQKYFIYFHQPADVRGMSFMVYKYPKKDDDRWLFMPALNLVKRIAAKDKRSSFVGSDFTYEDVSGRDLEEDDFSILREEKISDFGSMGQAGDCYVLKSVPKDPKSADYSYRLSWIDKESFLPLKEEYYDLKGELYKIFSAEELKQIQGFWTVTKRRMQNVKTGHQTLVSFKDIQYNLGMEENLFTERYLKNPPSKWIK